MAFLLEFPLSIFFLLLALIWQPQPRRKDDEFAPEADPAAKLSTAEMLRYLARVAERMLLFLVAGLGFIYSLVTDFAFTDAWEIIVGFCLIYSILMFIVQRTIPTSRMMILFLMAGIGFLVWRFAIYRAVLPEHHWGLLAACLVNWAFWQAIGRHYVPRDEIQVLK